jgi:hypothetical protein
MDKEDCRIVVTSEDDNGACILAAKFLTKWVIDMEAVQRALKLVWRPVGALTARDMGDNKAMFIFHDEVDLERVLANGPWSFDRLSAPHSHRRYHFILYNLFYICIFLGPNT